MSNEMSNEPTIIHALCDKDKLTFSVFQTQRKHVKQNFRTGNTSIRYQDVFKAQYQYGDGSIVKKEITKRLYNSLIAMNN